jgi:peroxiredoxin
MTLGPAVGAALPAFSVKDSTGVARTFESLKGPNGLVLIFFRSADW